MPGAEPFRLDGSGSLGVLLIHGFTGTPYEMRPLGMFLAESGISSVAPLLRGHGTHPNDMVSCRYGDWLADAETALDALLAEHQRVVLIGLSMGGAIALNLAARRSGDARLLAVISICAPIRLVDWRLGLPHVFSRLIRWQAWGKPDIKDTRAWAGHVGYRRFRSRAVHELIALLRETQQLLPRVHQPLLVVQARIDNVVPPTNAQAIYDGVASTSKRLVWLDDCYHVVTVDFSAPMLHAEVARFIAEEAAEPSTSSDARVGAAVAG